jgi:hypothetical protein
MNGNRDEVGILLEAGADPNLPDDVSSWRGWGERERAGKEGREINDIEAGGMTEFVNVYDS